MRRTLLIFLTIAVQGVDAHGGQRWCEEPTLASPELVDRIVKVASGMAGSRPRAVAQLESEGRLPSAAAAVRSNLAQRDFDKVRTLAHAWHLTGKEGFLAPAREVLMAWARTYRTRSNPIDEARLPTLAEGYALLRSGVEDDERDVIDRWFMGIYLGHAERLRNSRMVDNWRSHRIHVAASIAFALEDVEALREIGGHFRAQVMRNIGPDGTTVDFRKRNAIHYTVYTLQPLVQTGLLLASAGLYGRELGPDVALRLAAGLNWLVPYAQGERVRQEFDPPQLPIDRKRAEAGVPGYSGPWDPSRASELFWLAAYLDSSFLSVAEALATDPPDYLVVCRGRPARR